jgi:hypothetical protein
LVILKAILQENKSLKTVSKVQNNSMIKMKQILWADLVHNRIGRKVETDHRGTAWKEKAIREELTLAKSHTW